MTDWVDRELNRIGVGIETLGSADCVVAHYSGKGQITFADDGGLITLPLETATTRLISLGDDCGYDRFWEVITGTEVER